MTWSIVQCVAMHEGIVQTRLDRLDFDLTTYCPRVKERNRRIAPLFPSYLFIKDLIRFWEVRWTEGVLRVLMSGEKPATIDDKVITDIQAREVGGFIKLPRATSRWPKGAKVQIVRGNFQGKMALYEGQSPHERERVLLDLLGRKVSVELAGRDIVLIPVATNLAVT